MTAARVPLPPAHSWEALVRLAIAEDVGPGDLTTRLVVEPERTGRARIEARQPLVVCGLELAAAVFHGLDATLDVDARFRAGQRAEPGDVLAELSGNLRALLAGERTALNFLGRLCGIATFTRRFVDAVAGSGASIVDTRKTLPGWRVLDKYAAAIGGAVSHRIGLFDGVLLKDNHVALAGGVELAVKTARAGCPAGVRIQVEVESEEQARAAVAAGADFLLLDNRSPEELRSIVQRVGPSVLLEASGGVTLANVREVAASGVQRISIGALTHSAPSADVALEVEPEGGEPGGAGA